MSSIWALHTPALHSLSSDILRIGSGTPRFNLNENSATAVGVGYVGGTGVLNNSNAGGDWFAWFTAALMLGAAIGGIALGDLGDRIGRTRAMGVSTDLVTLAERTSPDQLYMLTGADIARWRLASRKL